MTETAPTVLETDSPPSPSIRAQHPTSAPPRRKRKPVRRFLASISRWVHIYLSMFGLGTILFFSITGLTLNHPDWFFDETLTQQSGQLSTEWLQTAGNPPDDWDEYDYSHQIEKLAIVEYLRAEHRLQGSVSDFLAFEDQCEVTFQGPGYAATARIARETGDYTLDIAANDLITVLNDLHKGRHTGTTWSWVIDISAVIGVLVTLSGFVLIFFLRLKRTTGLTVATVGTLLFVALYLLATA